MAMMLRVDDLKAKHAALEHQLEAEKKRPLPDEITIAELKRQKLRLKDRIADVTQH
jgi:hypothetical protein